MDIKLKNKDKEDGRKGSLKHSLFAAVLVISLFAAGFLALYPTFQKNARIPGGKGMQDGNFLSGLNTSNYIFYKDIVEKVEQNSYSYYDLYVDMEVTEQPGEEGVSRRLEAGGNAAGENAGEPAVSEQPDRTALTVTLPEEEDIDNIIWEIQSELDRSLRVDWYIRATEEVAQLMDYCVIDNKTGEFIKNTQRNIESLAGAGSGASSAQPQDDSAGDVYTFYVLVSYDSVGNPDRVSVRGENSDELLKRVQSVMKNRPLEGQLEMSSGQYGAEGTITGYSSEDRCIKTLHYRLDVPHDVTFIYAMTWEQKRKVQDNELMGVQQDIRYVYYQSGVMEIFPIMLVAMAVVVFIMMGFRWYGLHRIGIVKVPLEISVMAVLIWFIALAEWLTTLVEQTCTGEFSAIYARNLAFLPSESYQVLTVVLNFVILFLIFGGWFYVVNSFGGILFLGVGGFLRERSICARLCLWMGRGARRWYGQLKQEILHVDLGEEATKTLRKIVLINFVLLAAMCSLWFFGCMAMAAYSVALYFALKKYVNRIQKQYAKMLEATNSIAEGNLNTVFDEDFGIFESYKEELYQIQEGFRKAVDEEVKSQRMKTELITNVSHDLKTPLTAITTYIDLLKEDNITEGQRKEYLAVLEKKSLRLKTLIEDLFEVSRADSRNVSVNLVDVDICNLMRQVYLEYEDGAEEAGLVFRFRMPQGKVICRLDSQKTYRIFENLYINIIKYAMPGTRVYVDLEMEDIKDGIKADDQDGIKVVIKDNVKDGNHDITLEKKAVRIELKNISAMELQVEPDELTERFVRGDSSRNTEGSGLGLAIAKSFAQIQGGEMEVAVDGDLFKVTLWF